MSDAFSLINIEKGVPLRKKYLLIFFAMIPGVIIPCVCSAAPMILSISGRSFDGNKIIIKGVDFGNSGPHIIIFDDFEKGASGKDILTGPESARIGQWTELGAEKPCYTNSVSWSGKLSSQAEPSINTNFSMYTEFPPTKEFMLVYWVYLPAADNWPGEGTLHKTNWKQIWVRSDYPGRASDCVLVGLSSRTDNLGLTVAGNHAGRYTAYNAGHMTKGIWTRQLLYFKGSASGKGACFTQYLQANGRNTVRKGINDTRITNMVSNADNYCLVRFNAYGRVVSNSHPTMDDCYFASGPNCRARVEIGDNSRYKRCSNLAISTIDSWSSNSITATVRQGSFKENEPAYIFVVDADGEVSGGYPIVLGDIPGEDSVNSHSSGF